MVIRGRTRGNGRQLAQYLLTRGENDDIRILDVAGRGETEDRFVHHTLLSMSLTSELTNSDKGLYHAQINPAYGEDKTMDAETWQQAADLLENELGLNGQRRVMVLHTKKDRTHGHVVWERYDHDKGIMRSDSFSRLAQDRARKEMEQVFRHKPTPHRNQKRPEMKKLLSGLWQKLKTGREFIQEARKAGYQIAAGLQRRPFMVVDDQGRSFDLVRQINGARTKEVRDRLKGEKLLPEKEAIAMMRVKQQSGTAGQEKQDKEVSLANDNTGRDVLARQFAEGRNDMLGRERKEPKQRIRVVVGAPDPIKEAATHGSIGGREKETAAARQFAAGRKDIVAGEKKELDRRKQNTAEAFRDTKQEIIPSAEVPLEPKVERSSPIEKENVAGVSNAMAAQEAEKERRRQEILEQLRQSQERQRKRQRGLEPG